MLCFDCKADCLEPGLLDRWLQIDAFLQGEGLEDAKAAGSDEVVWISV